MIVFIARFTAEPATLALEASRTLFKNLENFGAEMLNK